MTDLATIHIHRDGLRTTLSQMPHMRAILDHEIDYTGDMNLDCLKDEPIIEMED